MTYQNKETLVQFGRVALLIILCIVAIITSAGVWNGVGIDLGVKDLAIVSDGKAFKNINKGSKVKRLEKRLRREQKTIAIKKL